MAVQLHDLGSLNINYFFEDSHVKLLPTVGLCLNDQLILKKEDASYVPQYSSSFLSSSLEDVSLESSDFNTEYMNIDEFLSDNYIAAWRDDTLMGIPTGTEKSEDISQNFNDESSFYTRSSIMGKERKLLPSTKKLKKVFIPSEMKDEKYWICRHKNNSAAKRSRDSRRMRENEIVMRTAFLEKENLYLHEARTKLWEENERLKATVAKYESLSLAGISLSNTTVVLT